MTTPANVTREHRAEAARLLAIQFVDTVSLTPAVDEWVATGSWDKIQMPTYDRVAQALADRDARIGELERGLPTLVDDGFSDGQRICSVCGGRESLPHTANHCFSGGIAVGQLDTANTKAQLARVVGALSEACDATELDGFEMRQTLREVLKGIDDGK